MQTFSHSQIPGLKPESHSALDAALKGRSSTNAGALSTRLALLAGPTSTGIALLARGPLFHLVASTTAALRPAWEDCPGYSNIHASSESHHVVALAEESRHVEIVLLEVRGQVRQDAGPHGVERNYFGRDLFGRRRLRWFFDE